MALINFNVNELPPSEGNDFEPIATGWYEVVMTKGAMKDTKAGNGKRLACEFDVIGPAYAGRKLFHGFNMVNPNAEAVKISQRQLGDFAEACGKEEVQDSDELIGIPVLAKVKVKEAKGGYDASNEIVTFKALGGAQPSAPKPAAANGAKPAAAAPWGR